MATPELGLDDRNGLRKISAAILGFVVILCASSVASNSADWSPVSVWVWDPPFDTTSPRTRESYIPLDAASSEWKVCVSIPHLKDAYWLGVNYGLVDEARRLGINMKLFEAGGYNNLDGQIAQIEACLDDAPDALIVSAIDYDKLNPTLEKAHAQGVPVIDLINGLSFPHLAAKSLGDFYDSGFAVGRYLVDLHEGSPDPVRVLWFPGPRGAGWVDRGEAGFEAALEDSNVVIVETAYGDTGKRAQGDLVAAALERHSDVDYIVGTAVTAEAAVPILRRERLSDRTKVLSYYFSPGVHTGLKRGTIVAAPSDLPAIQARIALDQAVRILEGEPYFKHVGPAVVVSDQNNIGDFDASTSLAPKGFKATFDVN